MAPAGLRGCGSSGTTTDVMDDLPPPLSIEELERQHGISPDRYCGLTPAEMSRAIVACHSRTLKPGEPVGFWPVVSPEIQLAALRAEFGPDAERILLLEQFFAGRVSRALGVDWALPGDEFDRAVVDGLRRHFPELTEDARRVITGSYSYSHAK